MKDEDKHREVSPDSLHPMREGMQKQRQGRKNSTPTIEQLCCSANHASSSMSPERHEEDEQKRSHSDDDLDFSDDWSSDSDYDSRGSGEGALFYSKAPSPAQKLTFDADMYGRGQVHLKSLQEGAAPQSFAHIAGMTLARAPARKELGSTSLGLVPSKAAETVTPLPQEEDLMQDQDNDASADAATVNYFVSFKVTGVGLGRVGNVTTRGRPLYMELYRLNRHIWDQICSTPPVPAPTSSDPEPCFGPLMISLAMLTFGNLDRVLKFKFLRKRANPVAQPELVGEFVTSARSLLEEAHLNGKAVAAAAKKDGGEDIIENVLRFGLQKDPITAESVMALAQAPCLDLPVWVREADQRKHRDREPTRPSAGRVMPPSGPAASVDPNTSSSSPDDSDAATANGPLSPSRMHATLSAAKEPRVFARGVLHKKRRNSIIKGWHEREFTLTSSAIHYRPVDAPVSATSGPQKSIRLTSASKAEPLPETAAGGPGGCILQVTPSPGEKPLQIRANDTDERDRWLAQVQARIRHLQQLDRARNFVFKKGYVMHRAPRRRKGAGAQGGNKEQRKSQSKAATAAAAQSKAGPQVWRQRWVELTGSEARIYKSARHAAHKHAPVHVVPLSGDALVANLIHEPSPAPSLSKSSSQSLPSTPKKAAAPKDKRRSSGKKHKHHNSDKKHSRRGSKGKDGHKSKEGHKRKSSHGSGSGADGGAERGLPGNRESGIDYSAAGGAAAAATATVPAFIGLQIAEEEDRVRVAHTKLGGPAHAAGLQIGDWLFSIDNQVLFRAADFFSAIEGKRPGDQVSVRVRRSGETHELTVQFSASHAATPTNNGNDNSSENNSPSEYEASIMLPFDMDVQWNEEIDAPEITGVVPGGHTAKYNKDQATLEDGREVCVGDRIVAIRDADGTWVPATGMRAIVKVMKNLNAVGLKHSRLRLYTPMMVHLHHLQPQPQQKQQAAKGPKRKALPVPAMSAEKHFLSLHSSDGETVLLALPSGAKRFEWRDAIRERIRALPASRANVHELSVPYVCVRKMQSYSRTTRDNLALAAAALRMPAPQPRVGHLPKGSSRTDYMPWPWAFPKLQGDMVSFTIGACHLKHMHGFVMGSSPYLELYCLRRTPLEEEEAERQRENILKGLPPNEVHEAHNEALQVRRRMSAQFDPEALHFYLGDDDKETDLDDTAGTMNVSYYLDTKGRNANSNGLDEAKAANGSSGSSKAKAKGSVTVTRGSSESAAAVSPSPTKQGNGNKDDGKGKRRTRSNRRSSLGAIIGGLFGLGGSKKDKDDANENEPLEWLTILVAGQPKRVRMSSSTTASGLRDIVCLRFGQPQAQQRRCTDYRVLLRDTISQDALPDRDMRPGDCPLLLLRMAPDTVTVACEPLGDPRVVALEDLQRSLAEHAAGRHALSTLGMDADAGGKAARRHSIGGGNHNNGGDNASSNGNGDSLRHRRRRSMADLLHFRQGSTGGGKGNDMGNSIAAALDPRWQRVHGTPAQQNTLKPRWATFMMDVETLCFGDLNRPILLRVCTGARVIGCLQTTLAGLIVSRKHALVGGSSFSAKPELGDPTPRLHSSHPDFRGVMFARMVQIYSRVEQLGHHEGLARRSEALENKMAEAENQLIITRNLSAQEGGGAQGPRTKQLESQLNDYATQMAKLPLPNPVEPCRISKRIDPAHVYLDSQLLWVPGARLTKVQNNLCKMYGSTHWRNRAFSRRASLESIPGSLDTTTNSIRRGSLGASLSAPNSPNRKSPGPGAASGQDAIKHSASSFLFTTSLGMPQDSPQKPKMVDV